MLAVLRDPQQPLAERKWAAQQAAPYLHRRLSTLERSEENGVRHEDALETLA